MPLIYGVKVNVLSKTDFGIFPEFPHPESSQFTNRNSDTLDESRREVSSFDHGHPSFSPKVTKESKADRLLGKETAISVYIPSIADTRFWLRYTIMESAAKSKYYFFKMLMNGREIVSWGVAANTPHSGQISRAFFDPGPEYSYSDVKSGITYKRMGIEKRAFFFAEAKGKSVVTDGGIIEIRVFRARERERRIQEPLSYKSQHEYGVALHSGGLLDDVHAAKFYDWLLVDSTHAPYAVFKFHYRSWDSLAAHNLIPENSERTLLPMSPSILQGCGHTIEQQEMLDQKHFDEFERCKHGTPRNAELLRNVPATLTTREVRRGQGDQLSDDSINGLNTVEDNSDDDLYNVSPRGKQNSRKLWESVGKCTLRKEDNNEDHFDRDETLVTPKTARGRRFKNLSNRPNTPFANDIEQSLFPPQLETSGFNFFNGLLKHKKEKGSSVGVAEVDTATPKKSSGRQSVSRAREDNETFGPSSPRPLNRPERGFSKEPAVTLNFRAHVAQDGRFVKWMGNTELPAAAEANAAAVGENACSVSPVETYILESKGDSVPASLTRAVTPRSQIPRAVEEDPEADNKSRPSPSVAHGLVSRPLPNVPTRGHSSQTLCRSSGGPKRPASIRPSMPSSGRSGGIFADRQALQGKSKVHSHKRAGSVDDSSPETLKYSPASNPQNYRERIQAVVKQRAGSVSERNGLVFGVASYASASNRSRPPAFVAPLTTSDTTDLSSRLSLMSPTATVQVRPVDDFVSDSASPELVDCEASSVPLSHYNATVGAYIVSTVEKKKKATIANPPIIGPTGSTSRRTSVSSAVLSTSPRSGSGTQVKNNGAIGALSDALSFSLKKKGGRKKENDAGEPQWMARAHRRL
ncbi:hypothetical protein BJ875DRAFT_401985 [Amylocarpus encephaloides]|uniref:Uncharacterized protein n=1 Tax=Amylocarpus encephaloides TaxID=45428 RepID=A0A9P8C595_9HELO|nr:hypothetical protein BJ875DRAFT_401985 [Amylocarpus encephaloides]